jgi:hypothetical protein
MNRRENPGLLSLNLHFCKFRQIVVRLETAKSEMRNYIMLTKKGIYIEYL